MESVVRLLNIPPDNTNEINHDVFLSKKSKEEAFKNFVGNHESA